MVVAALPQGLVGKTALAHPVGAVGFVSYYSRLKIPPK
jgi:hypothetical protein